MTGFRAFDNKTLEIMASDITEQKGDYLIYLEAILIGYADLRDQRDALLAALKLWRHADGCFCEAAFSGPGCHPPHSPECVQSQAAIAKAEGGEA